MSTTNNSNNIGKDIANGLKKVAKFAVKTSATIVEDGATEIGTGLKNSQDNTLNKIDTHATLKPNEKTALKVTTNIIGGALRGIAGLARVIGGGIRKNL